MAHSRPDEKRTSTQTAQVVKPDVARTAPEVVARPVDRTQGVSESSTARLVRGLQEGSPALNAYVEARQKRVDSEDQSRARADAETQFDPEDTYDTIWGRMNGKKSAAYQREYLAASGHIMAARQNDALTQLIDERVTRGNEDFDAVMQEFLQGQLKGVDDADFTSGYLKRFGYIETDLRNKHTNRVQAQRELEFQGDAREYAVDFIQNPTFENLDPEQQFAYINTLETDLKHKFNLTNEELNELWFDTVSTYALEGHPEVLKFAKQKRENGSSLWTNPKFQSKWQNLERMALAEKNRKAKDIDTAADKLQKDLEDQRERGIYSMLFSGDKAGAIKAYHDMVLKGLLPPPSLNRIEGHLGLGDDPSILTDAQKIQRDTLKAQYAVLAGQGKLTIGMITAKSIHIPGGLFDTDDMSELFTLMDTAPDRTNNIFNSPMYNEYEGVLVKIVAPKAGLVDPNPQAERLAAMAKRSFFERVKELNEDGTPATDAEIKQAHEEVISVYAPLTVGSVDSILGIKPPYASLQELDDDYTKRKGTDNPMTPSTHKMYEDMIRNANLFKGIK